MKKMVNIVIIYKLYNDLINNISTRLHGCVRSEVEKIQ